MNSDWMQSNSKEVSVCFRHFKKYLADCAPSITKNTEFKIAMATLRREIKEIVLDASEHMDYTSDFLKRACLFLVEAAKGNNDPSAAQRLLKEVDNYLSSPKSYCDPLEMWPDGPCTGEGVCWVCNTDGNVRWLADPLEDEPRDRKPWCQRCYKVRRRKD
jgi:hypothetical protein